MQEITISPKKVAKYLFLIISGLLTLHIIGQVAKFGFGSNQLYGFVPLFFMGGESNIPAFYSSAAIFTCAVLLFVIGVVRSRVRSGDHLHWLGLALIFVFLSMDEALRFHERLLRPMHNLFGDEGIFHLGWTVPYAFLVFIVGLVYRKFVFNLPTRSRNLFVLAGFIYIGGALGMEVLESFYVEKHGWQNPIAVTMITIEDTMEMSGIALFLYALTSYIDVHIKGINVRIKS